MFKSYQQKGDVLERFRIKAHLRSYVKDPIIIDTALLKKATTALKKLPYDDKDPTDAVAIKLVLEAYRLGHFRVENMTDAGYEIINENKYHSHSQLTTKGKPIVKASRNYFTLKNSITT